MKNQHNTLDFTFEIKSIDEETNSVTAVFSHSQKDRAGDILPPEVLLAGAKNFLKNPIMWPEI